MGYIAGVLALVGAGLLMARKYRAGFVVWCFAGLFGWGTIMRSS